MFIFSLSGIPGTIDAPRLFIQASNLFMLADAVPGAGDRFEWVIVGGAVMVGAIYWFVYLRKQSEAPSAQPTPSGDS